MRLNVLLFVFALAVCFSRPVFSQSTEVTPLSVGDRVPDLFFSSVINYPNRQLGLSDFKGKWVILDFWNTGCTSCIQAFPKLEALQASFSDKLQIITVTKEAKAAVDERFSRYPQQRLRLATLPTIFQDSVLSALFPHRVVSHHVWINPQGVVAAITHGHNATAQKFSMLSSGIPVYMAVKIDKVPDYFSDMSLGEITAQQGKVKPMYQSQLTRYTDELASLASITTVKDTVHSVLRKTLPNKTALQLFMYALSRDKRTYHFNALNRIICEDISLSDYLAPDDKDVIDEWTRDHTFSYEQILPVRDSAKAFSLMLEDLNRYFGSLYGISVSEETRKVRCYVLTRTGAPTGLPQTKPKNDSDTEYLDNFKKVRYHQYPAHQLFERLKYGNKELFHNATLPFINNAGDEPVTVTLPTKPESIAALSRALEAAGLAITEQDCEIPMLIIKKL